MQEITEKDVLTLDFAIDKLSNQDCQKLLKELATLKAKMNKIIKVQEIKSKQW